MGRKPRPSMPKSDSAGPLDGLIFRTCVGEGASSVNATPAADMRPSGFMTLIVYDAAGRSGTCTRIVSGVVEKTGAAVVPKSTALPGRKFAPKTRTSIPGRLMFGETAITVGAGSFPATNANG